MAQDAYGNYQVSDLRSPYTAGGSMFGGLSGVGVPDDSLGANGDIYVNITNGDVYTKTGDTWVLQQAGGGGATALMLGSEPNPNGFFVPANPAAAALYYQDSDVNNFWRWSVEESLWNQSIG